MKFFSKLAAILAALMLACAFVACSNDGGSSDDESLIATFSGTLGGGDECRAWTIHAGDKAPQAAGVIHTDFEKGFIKAEAYTVNDLRQYGTEAKIKEAGKYRQEGKEYVVQDGDVLFFKFNVTK